MAKEEKMKKRREERVEWRREDTYLGVDDTDDLFPIL